MDGFALRVLASFVIAGAWIGTATMISERYGSRVGGLVGNLPSNIVVSFIFITLTQDVRFTADAARAVPLGMTINNFFMLAFMVGARRGLGVAIGLSLAIWFGALLAVHAAGLPGWRAATAMFAASVAVVFLVMERGLKLRTHSARAVKYSPVQVTARMIFAGAVVATSVIVAHSVGPYWAGLFSTFPAVMMSTLVILSMAQGPAFAGGVAKVLVLSSANILAFAFVAAAAYPKIGLVAGTLLAYTAAVLWVAALRPVVARLS
jgi:hypothetical protein